MVDVKPLFTGAPADAVDVTVLPEKFDLRPEADAVVENASLLTSINRSVGVLTVLHPLTSI